MLFSQAAAGRSADLNRFELLAVLNASADIVDNLSQGCSHRHFNQAGIDDIACQRKGLCSRASFCAD